MMLWTSRNMRYVYNFEITDPPALADTKTVRRNGAGQSTRGQRKGDGTDL